MTSTRPPHGALSPVVGVERVQGHPQTGTRRIRLTRHDACIWLGHVFPASSSSSSYSKKKFQEPALNPLLTPSVVKRNLGTVFTAVMFNCCRYLWCGQSDALCIHAALVGWVAASYQFFSVGCLSELHCRKLRFSCSLHTHTCHVQRVGFTTQKRQIHKSSVGVCCVSIRNLVCSVLFLWCF